MLFSVQPKVAYRQTYRRKDPQPPFQMLCVQANLTCLSSDPEKCVNFCVNLTLFCSCATINLNDIISYSSPLLQRSFLGRIIQLEPFPGQTLTSPWKLFLVPQCMLMVLKNPPIENWLLGWMKYEGCFHPMQKAVLLDRRPCLSFSLLAASHCSFDGIIRDCLCEASRDIPNVPSVPEAVLHCHTLSHTHCLILLTVQCSCFTHNLTFDLFLLDTICHSLSMQ